MKVTVALLLLQYVFLYECFERIQEEHTWRHRLEVEQRREAAAIASLNEVAIRRTSQQQQEPHGDEQETTTGENEGEDREADEEQRDEGQNQDNKWAIMITMIIDHDHRSSSY